MRVLHVIPSLSTADGGPTNAVLAMERALAALGVGVETATTVDRTEAPAPPSAPPGAVHRGFERRTKFYKASPQFARWIGLHARDYDLLHIHALFSFTSWAAARAARRAGVPYIVRPLGTLSDYGLTRRRPWLKRLSLAVIEKPLLRHAAALHFTSEQEAREARTLGLSWHEAIVPLGVEPPSVAAGPGRFAPLRGSPCLLFLSRLDPKKNVEGLLRAARQLLPAFPSLRLLIVGDGPADYLQRLTSLATELGLEGHTVWAGRLEGASRDEAFAAADAFVLPSHSENFGIAAVEAMLAGLPCVLGEGVAVAGEAARAGAALVTGTDADSIARAVERIIAAPAEAERMGASAARFAREEFSVGAMGTRLLALYEDILRQQARRPT
jgi:glycosyltransferase involved in cell wall biosynthesis